MRGCYTVLFLAFAVKGRKAVALKNSTNEKRGAILELSCTELIF